MMDELDNWVSEITPKPAPDISLLEPTIQSLGLYFSFIGKELTNEQLIILALAGYIATRARIIDEEKFVQIPPEKYFEQATYSAITHYKKDFPKEIDFFNFLESLKHIV